MNREGSRSKAGWIVLLLMTIHAVLVFFRLDRHGLWLDEIMGIEAAVSAWPDLWRFFRSLPEQHPLYYVLLRPWLALWGDSAVALRSLSALFSVATVPAMFWLAKSLMGEKPALLTAALFALSPFSVFYGQEGRMYSLLLLLVCLASTAWLAVLRRPEAWSAKAGYLLLAVAGVYTHFFFAFVVLAHGVLGFVWPGLPDWRSRVRKLLLPASVGVLYLPWVALILINFPEGQGWKGPMHAVFAVPYSLLRFAVGYSFVMPNHEWQARIGELVAADRMPLLVATLSFGSLSLLGTFAVRSPRASETGRALAVLGLTPVIVPLLLSPFVVLAGERYFMVAYPVLLCLVALGAWRGLKADGPGRRPLTWSVLVALLGVWTLGHARYFEGDSFGKEGWREVVSDLADSHHEGETVYYFPYHVGQAIAYHLRMAGVELPLTPIEDCKRIAGGTGWFIVSHRGAAEEVLGCLSSAQGIQERRFVTFGVGIHLFRAVHELR